MSRTTRIVMASFAVLVLLGAACSSKTPTGNGSPAASTAANEVTVKNLAFTPATLNVKAGDTVTWSFADGQTPHTATSDDKTSFDSGSKSGGMSFQHTFATAGTFKYHCTIHPTMLGTIVVS